MKSNLGLLTKLAGIPALVALFVALPVTASAADYMLSAGKWGKKQDKAVAAAGGTIIWSHAKTGLASVYSDNPNFLALVEADRAFKSVAADVMLDWQDENFSEQTITPEDEFLYSLQWNMPAIDAPSAWDAGCTGAGVRVGIADGGIDPTHYDLQPNMDTSCSVSFVPDFDFDEDTGTFWHGMHVAGIVGAANNSGGVIGVAPEVTMTSIKVLHSGSGNFSWIIGGILFAGDPAAFGYDHCEPVDILNMSLGADIPKRFLGGPGGSLVAYMNRAINFATSQGVLSVSAAGNDAYDLGQSQDLTTIPAESGNGIAVSATGPLDWFGVFGPPGDPSDPAVYSNYGEGTIWVAAPGGQPGITATLEVNSPPSIAGTKLAQIAFYGPPPNGHMADVALWTDPVDTTGNPHDACEGGVDPTVAGKFALIHRGSCGFVDKTAASEASGSFGTIISNNRPGLPPLLGGDLPTAVFPSVAIGQADGADIEGELPGVNATMDENDVGLADQVVSACKIGWCFAFGTSMASPAAAGVAALALQANPNMSVGRLKAKLAQTADDLGPRGNDEFYGHGFVNAYRACTE